jgi:uncharacterized integral membrane protein
VIGTIPGMSNQGPEPGAGWQQIEETSDEKSWGPRLIIAGLALLAAAIFIAQNNEPTETRFLFLSGEPRLFNVILVSMLLGAALGQVVPVFLRRRRKKKKGAAGTRPAPGGDASG